MGYVFIENRYRVMSLLISDTLPSHFRALIAPSLNAKELRRALHWYIIAVCLLMANVVPFPNPHYNFRVIIKY